MNIQNPFSAAAVPEQKIKRNAYDLSRQNLFSTHWGRLTPCFLEEVIPGDTFEIDSSLVIQGMPTVFPLQTRCRVSVEFYYSRNRTVCDNFEDYIFNTKSNIELPWLRLSAERAKQMISTNSLGDMFGLPSTVGTDTVTSMSEFTFDSLYTIHSSPVSGMTITDITSYFLSDFSISTLTPLTSISSRTSSSDRGFYALSTRKLLPLSGNRLSFLAPSTSSSSSSYPNRSNISIVVNGRVVISRDNIFSIEQSTNIFSWSVPDDIKSYTEKLYSSGTYYQILLGYYYSQDIEGVLHSILAFYNSDNSFFNFIPTASSRSTFSLTSLPVDYPVSNVFDATDDSVISTNPFIGDSPSLKVNALPFRHYEMICNYYYRNDKNNPFILNGEAQYNEFIPTHAPGPDDNLYQYHYKNWELDRFTSATQSPQFGEAPLVGLTFNGADTAEISFSDADIPDKKYTATVGLDGDRVATIEDFSSDIPSANLRRIQQMIHYGISINDLRVTNAFQRFKESQMRRGLRYRNQLKSHFNVSVDYPDIDVPQYIGGYSGELNVSKITSTAQTSEANLGDFNGSLTGVISSKHKIHHYCVEHGFIMGIVSITPIPVYTQSCNKVMIKRDYSDFFLPEFGKIGHVPIHYSEVMPLQTSQGQSVDDVFGYQRAHYDYMRSFDQAHGYFRTNLKDFVLQRIFAHRPSLVQDFTVINPEQLTDVFVTRNIADEYNVGDKFLCNFYCHCVVAREIPRFGTPSLE